MFAARRLLVAALLLAGAAAFKPASPEPQQRSAILVSWDGASREHVNACLKRNELPNLARLLAHGRMVDVEVTGHTTDTKAGHAQLLTGYDPELTGVYSNTRFRPIPAGFSIFERLQQAFGNKGIATVMLTGKAMGLGPGAPRLAAQAEDPGQAPDDASEKPAMPARRIEKIRQAGEQNVLGQPFHLTKQSLSAWAGDMPRGANAVGQRAVAYVKRFAGTGRFFLFIHFADVDIAGHQEGETSSAYNDALVLLDTWLGRIVAQLEASKIDGSTAVYITSDHGFDPGTTHHNKASHSFLASTDRQIVSAGEQRDITPTILQALGVDISKIAPALPGKSLRKEP